MDNFYDTANRMYKSSQILHNNNEYHNACYMAGYVVECYTKIIVGLFSTNIPSSYRHNLSNLNIALQHILNGNSSLSPYILNGSLDFVTILSNWNPVNLRYIDNANSLNNQSLSTSFQNEIQLAMQKLAELQIDGHNLI